MTESIEGGMQDLDEDVLERSELLLDTRKYFPTGVYIGQIINGRLI